MFLMTNREIIYNVVALVGMTFFFVSALMKTKVRLLIMQCIAHIINIASWAIMGAWTAIIPELTNVVRNAFILGKRNTRLVSILLIVVSTIIGILINVFADGNTLIGYLPIFASLQFSIVVLIPNIKLPYVKLSMALSNICFIIFSLITKNYVFAACNAITCIASIAAVITYYVKGEREALDSDALDNDGLKSNKEE